MKKPALGICYTDDRYKKGSFTDWDNEIFANSGWQVHDAGYALYDYEKDEFIVYELSKATGIKHGHARLLGDNFESQEKHFNDFLNHSGYENDFSSLVMGMNCPESRMRLKVNRLSGGIAGYSDHMEHLVKKEESHLGCYHHVAHTYSAYIQSPFRKCLSLSFDGGSNESSFRLTLIDNGKVVKTRAFYDKYFGYYYNLLGELVPEICKTVHGRASDSLMDGMDRPGKFMGCTALGKPNKVVRALTDQLFALTPSQLNKKQHFAIRNNLASLCDAGEVTAYDIAYNGQKSLEYATAQFLIQHKDWLDEANNNLILTGGIALNVLNNAYIRDLFKCKTFVCSAPNDSGLPLGILTYHLCQDENWSWLDPANRKSLRFATLPVKDYDEIPYHIQDRGAKEVTLKDVADVILAGNIVGTVWDNIEFGPRALGHRSILCDPSISDMKDIINSKVKFREWFRPFAPACRKEDAPKYFISDSFDNLESMSYVVTCKSGTQKNYPAISHVDGTGRLQTVSRDDPEDADFYKLLGYIPTDILLNTSFNVGGKPILNTVEEALWMLDNTGLDNVVVKYEGRFYLFGT